MLDKQGKQEDDPPMTYYRFTFTGELSSVVLLGFGLLDAELMSNGKGVLFHFEHVVIERQSPDLSDLWGCDYIAMTTGDSYFPTEKSLTLVNT